MSLGTEHPAVQAQIAVLVVLEQPLGLAVVVRRAHRVKQRYKVLHAVRRHRLADMGGFFVVFEKLAKLPAFKLFRNPIIELHRPLVRRLRLPQHPQIVHEAAAADDQHVFLAKLLQHGADRVLFRWRTFGVD